VTAARLVDIDPLEHLFPCVTPIAGWTNWRAALTPDSVEGFLWRGNARALADWMVELRGFEPLPPPVQEPACVDGTVVSKAS
jgi:hypothetical protein